MGINTQPGIPPVPMELLELPSSMLNAVTIFDPSRKSTASRLFGVDVCCVGSSLFFFCSFLFFICTSNDNLHNSIFIALIVHIMYNIKYMKKRDLLILKPTEERIFELLQKNKQLSVSEISRILNIARTSIYNSIGTLIKKNIIIKDDFFYSLCSNSYSKHDFKQDNPLVAINKFFEELLNLKKGEIIYSIETDEEIKSLFNNRNNFLNWQKKISEKAIILKGVGSLNALQYFKQTLSNNENEVIKTRSGSARFFDEPLLGSCTLVMVKDSVVFLSRAKKFFYRIDNQYIACFLKEIIDRIYTELEYRTTHK